MSFVEREHILDLVSGGENDDRRIGKADAEVGMPLDGRPGLLRVLGPERLKLVGTPRRFGKERRAQQRAVAAVRR